ncbi:hypothetical protein VNO77_37647 [Canavalia gladiata]|uniref:Uncharacterized protein n=1 Tax=Canavalia gladiata TaxID=3824 RepID=A0AAN9KBA6_CANGL
MDWYKSKVAAIIMPTKTVEPSCMVRQNRIWQGMFPQNDMKSLLPIVPVSVHILTYDLGVPIFQSQYQLRIQLDQNSVAWSIIFIGNNIHEVWLTHEDFKQNSLHYVKPRSHILRIVSSVPAQPFLLCFLHFYIVRTMNQVLIYQNYPKTTNIHQNWNKLTWFAIQKCRFEGTTPIPDIDISLHFITLNQRYPGISSKLLWPVNRIARANAVFFGEVKPIYKNWLTTPDLAMGFHNPQSATGKANNSIID